MFADVRRASVSRRSNSRLRTHRLFQRGVGDATDIVQRDVHVPRQGDRSITLRRKARLGTVRAYLEHGMASEPSPLKFFYCLNNFRYERPQKGRYREFTQFGVELFGSESPMAEVEVLSLLVTYFAALGLDEYQLHLNSIGCADCRPAYHAELKAFLEAPTALQDCQSRSRRIRCALDCKNESCQAVLKATADISRLQRTTTSRSDQSDAYEKIKLVWPRLLPRTVFNFCPTGSGQSRSAAWCYDDGQTLGSADPRDRLRFRHGRLRLELKYGIPCRALNSRISTSAFDDTRRGPGSRGSAQRRIAVKQTSGAQLQSADDTRTSAEAFGIGTENQAETVQLKDSIGRGVSVPKTSSMSTYRQLRIAAQRRTHMANIWRLNAPVAPPNWTQSVGQS